MHCLSIILTQKPTTQDWDRMSGLLFTLGSCGLDEGQEDGPEGETALTAGHHPNDEDEFLSAISPGLLQPPNTFKAYFNEHDAAIHAASLFEGAFIDYAPVCNIESIQDVDYSTTWKDSFTPIFAAPHWLIHAPWHTPEQIQKIVKETACALPSKNETLHHLIIEPGMAFGTGTHETTRSCLTLMSTHFKSLSTEASVVLDFGCGSGILAIGAKKLGAHHVDAVDIDPLAIQATIENARVNGVIIEASLPSQNNISKKYNAIVANVLKGTLLEFKPQFLEWITPGGLLILSGLLNEQANQVSASYCASGFSILDSLTLGEWTSLALRAP